MISLSGTSGDTVVEWSWGINARSIGNIKKSGKLLSCWTTLKVGSEAKFGTMILLLIVSNVLENSSTFAHTDPAGVDCHA
ncbi:hypothetical protein BDR03DRAFT_962773 [Suillus americanus]|nr:hypothetical protein BDR03DRAFT_962773 [Suillus americanus]